jgi:GntR family transcriptional regulator
MNHLSEVVKMKQSLDHQRPIFQQIKETIEENILNGAFPEEERVPSTNEFAKMYRINPATAAKGINQLVDHGILYKKRGIGMFVCAGAKEVLLTQRKEEFYNRFIVPLKKEAQHLGITVNELKELLDKGEIK